jgi:hypothetical protein
MPYFHMSPTKLLADKPLQKKDGPHVAEAVEDLLETRRPTSSLPRSQSVFMGETEDGGRHGLRYPMGYLHLVEPSPGPFERRDNCWIGVLQMRLHGDPKARSIGDRKASHLTNEQIADNYWSGEASHEPNWDSSHKTRTLFAVSTSSLEKFMFRRWRRRSLRFKGLIRHPTESTPQTRGRFLSIYHAPVRILHPDHRQCRACRAGMVPRGEV